MSTPEFLTDTWNNTMTTTPTTTPHTPADTLTALIRALRPIAASPTKYVAAYAGMLVDLMHAHDLANSHPKRSPDAGRAWVEATKLYNASRMYAMAHSLRKPNDVLREQGYLV